MKIEIDGKAHEVVDPIEARAIAREELAEAEEIPVYFGCNVTVPASGIILAPAPESPIGPPMQKEWDIRRITVTGSDPVTAEAGSVWFYQKPSSAPLGMVSGEALDFIDWASTIPLPAYWDRQVIIPGGNQLIFLVTGATSGHQIVITGLAIERPKVKKNR